MNEVRITKKSWYGLLTVAAVTAGFFVAGSVSAAACPTLESGKVVRVMAKNAFYLVGEDGLLSKYLSPEACNTWRADCLKGVKLTTTCLKEKSVNAHEIGFREGSRLVKYTNKYFGIGPNNTLYPISANAAKSLYGVAWKSYARPINKKMFANYTVGAAVQVNMPHDGMLVKKAKTNMVYKMEDGMMKLVEGTMPAFMKGMVRAIPAKVFDAINSEGSESVKTEVKASTDTKIETSTETKVETKTEVKAEEPKTSTDSSDGWVSYTDGLSAFGFKVYLPSTAGVSAGKANKSSSLGVESYSIVYDYKNVANNVNRIDLAESSDPVDLAYTVRDYAAALYAQYKGGLEGASVGAALSKITCAWPTPTYSDKTLGGNSWTVLSFMDGCKGGQNVYPIYKQLTYAVSKVGGKMLVVFINNNNLDVRTTGTTSLDPAKAVNTTFVDTFLGKIQAK